MLGGLSWVLRFALLICPPPPSTQYPAQACKSPLGTSRPSALVRIYDVASRHSHRRPGFDFNSCLERGVRRLYRVVGSARTV